METSKQTEQTEKLPFEEAIVDAIKYSGHEPTSMLCLADIITRTKISYNHQAIVDAWIEQCRILGLGEDRLVPLIVMAQKQKVEAEVKTEIKAIAEKAVYDEFGQGADALFNAVKSGEITSRQRVKKELKDLIDKLRSNLSKMSCP